MMKHKSLLLFVIALTLSSVVSAAGRLYHWVDKDGKHALRRSGSGRVRVERS